MGGLHHRRDIRVLVDIYRIPVPRCSDIDIEPNGIKESTDVEVQDSASALFNA